MISKSTILHLRIPFSLFLLPFFCFAASQVNGMDWKTLLGTFFIIHFLFYPSSNGYNSYYDKDEESIGGLKNPPPVRKELLIVSILLEFVAIIGAWFINWRFSILLIGIILASRAYSHPAIRLKKMPIIGLITVAFFQGGYTFFMATVAISNQNFDLVFNAKILWAAFLCSLMLIGSYPMTQIYQHKEDGKRGDMTISRMLGIEGTFLWTGLSFFLTNIGFLVYYYTYYTVQTGVYFLLFLLPTIIYFSLWYLRVRQDSSEADYTSTMRLNLLSSLSFIGFFIFLYLSQ